MTYSNIKYNFMEKELGKLFVKYKVFFAFNKDQFNEGMKKNNIPANEPLSEIIGGGIMPRKNKADFRKDFDNLYSKMVAKIKKLDPDLVIRYELANYESWYTRDISSAWQVLKDYGYTKDQVLEVFNKYQKEL